MGNKSSPALPFITDKVIQDPVDGFFTGIIEDNFIPPPFFGSPNDWVSGTLPTIGDVVPAVEVPILNIGNIIPDFFASQPIPIPSLPPLPSEKGRGGKPPIRPRGPFSPLYDTIVF
jgi:hypothetical protein